MIQIHRTDFAAKARKHADGVKGWISDRLEYALGVLRFLKDGTALDAKWHSTEPIVTAEAMGKLFPIITKETALGAHATPGNVDTAIRGARIAGKVSPQAANIIALASHVQARLDEILISVPDVLETLEGTVVRNFNAVKGSVEFKFIAWLFDYDWWSSQGACHMPWRPWHLGDVNRVRTCPYCNRAYTFSTICEDGTRLRNFQFDHYFSQGDHPLLRLSYYNLIPACTNCNSGGYKGTTDFSTNEYFHPFFEGFNDDCKFHIKESIANALPLDWIENAEALPLELVTQPGVAVDKQNKVRNHNTVFHLVDVYRGHGKEVDRIVRDYRYYTKERLLGLSRVFTLLGIDIDKDARSRMRVLPLDHLEESILSKLTRDLVDQMGSGNGD